MKPDRFRLYEAAVQDVEFDVHLFKTVYRRRNGASFTRLREDFCGTARLAREWVKRSRNGEAWGIDLNPGPLAWARAHHVPPLGAAGRRLHLVRGDVRQALTPPVDVIAALNCSYWVFKRRSVLLDYLRGSRRALRPGGLLFLDVFGGEGAMRALTERRRVRGARDAEGHRVAPFTYTWEQKSFNPIDHNLRAAIHLEVDRGRAIRNAFTYDWRMWSLPELADAMRDVGFSDVEFYVQGWDDRTSQPLDYRRRVRFENQEAWLAYIVGRK